MVNDVLSSITTNVENHGIKNINGVRKHDSAIASFTSKMQTDVNTIREFLSDRMYNHEKVKNMSKNAGRTISALYDLLTDDQKISRRERQKQILLARDRGELHLGRDPKKS